MHSRFGADLFSRRGACPTQGTEHDLSSLTKSMVKRLLRDDLLVVKGFRPDWVHSDNGFDG
ncbi:MAG: hypothetical protein K8S97_13945 [Anaerolineae bacterium]|nr:hypothetical protein [Anaerolineae bacterium]